METKQKPMKMFFLLDHFGFPKMNKFEALSDYIRI